MHPQFGPLPPGRRGKPLPPTPAQLSPDIDPVFGVRPGPPPQKRGVFRPTQEGGEGLSGHFTSSASDSLDTAATVSSFSPPYQNGEGERPPGIDRRFSDISYTTTSAYSTTSTEQSALDYGSRANREFVGSGRSKLQEMEARFDNLKKMYEKKDQEVVSLTKEAAYWRDKCREVDEQNMDLKKQYEQLREKMRNHTISEQKHMLESYRPESSDELGQLHRQLEEKEQRMALLEKQVEQYQQDNVQLQLSLSSNSARPHHLPIGSPLGRPPTIHRPAFSPARSPYLGGGGPATGITPMKTAQIGDSLNQHNIHLQRSRSPRRNSPAFSPAKDSGKALSITLLPCLNFVLQGVGIGCRVVRGTLQWERPTIISPATPPSTPVAPKAAVQESRSRPHPMLSTVPWSRHWRPLRTLNPPFYVYVCVLYTPCVQLRSPIVFFTPPSEGVRMRSQYLVLKNVERRRWKVCERLQCDLQQSNCVGPRMLERYVSMMRVPDCRIISLLQICESGSHNQSTTGLVSREEGGTSVAATEEVWEAVKCCWEDRSHLLSSAHRVSPTPSQHL